MGGSGAAGVPGLHCSRPAASLCRYGGWLVSPPSPPPLPLLCLLVSLFLPFSEYLSPRLCPHSFEALAPPYSLRSLWFSVPLFSESVPLLLRLAPVLSKPQSPLPRLCLDLPTPSLFILTSVPFSRICLSLGLRSLQSLPLLFVSLSSTHPPTHTPGSAPSSLWSLPIHLGLCPPSSSSLTTSFPVSFSPPPSLFPLCHCLFFFCPFSFFPFPGPLSPTPTPCLFHPFLNPCPPFSGSLSPLLWGSVLPSFSLGPSLWISVPFSQAPPASPSLILNLARTRGCVTAESCRSGARPADQGGSLPQLPPPLDLGSPTSP